MSPLPSASKLGLAMTCPASAVLPRVDRVVEAAETGNVIHDFMRSLASMSRDEALARVPDEYRARCEAIDLSALPLDVAWEAEPALALDVDTEAVRFLGHDVGRKYGERQSPTEMFMSMDMVALQDGGALVCDWKTGAGKVTSAATNWQLRACALAVARWKGVDAVRVAIVRLPESGDPFVDTADFDSFELDLIASELRELARRLERPERVVPTMGEHCRYCDAFASCPAQGKLLARVVRAPDQVERDVVDLLTPETAAKAFERLRLVDAAVKKMWAALFQYARHEGGIPLPNGEVFGEVTVEREALDPLIVRQVLVELHGQETADAACDYETSKAAIDRALRPVYEARKRAGQGVTLKALREQVLRAVESEGGVTLVKRTEVKAHRPALPAGEAE